MRNAHVLVAIPLLLLLGKPVRARMGQNAPSTPVGAASQADFETERSRANELFTAGRVLDALPLYEDLEQRDPNRAVFAERRAAGLIAKTATITEREPKSALMHKAYDELLRAQSLGDNSPYVLNQVDNFKRLFASPGGDGAGTQAASTNPKTALLLQQAEIAFAKSDYASAYRQYGEAAQQDPGAYEPALLAGDAAFRMHNEQAAGTWFAKAAAINPDIETAYRYWGDALMAANQPAEAREKYIDAVVAQPYMRTTWGALQDWARRTNTRLSLVHIDHPEPSQQRAAVVSTDDSSGRSVWGVYLSCRDSYRTTLFRQQFPKAPAYRHTLAEEVYCLKQATAALNQKHVPADKLDPGLNMLLTLDARNLLEPYVLLHGADPEIAQDYAGYRETHRDQLHTFIAQFDIVTVPF